MRIAGRKNIQFRFDMLNVFDTVNFTPESGVGNTTLADWEVTSANWTARHPARDEVQLVSDL